MAVNINIDSQVSQTITDGVTDKAPSENAVFDALALKVDKVTGKQLSTEDYTTTEKSKLTGIAAGAEVNVNADWNATSGDAQILNKPTISSSITIGTTPITSGVAGRVLFEGAGNVAQEDAGFTYDETLKRLTLKAVGALATDIAFRIRNSADTLDIIRANGAGDVFVGQGAGRVSTGTQNTFIGLNAGYNNTTGINNTANGVSALFGNTTGGSNTANGLNALLRNTTGSNNIAQGRDSGRYIADGTTDNSITNTSVYLGNNTKALANNQTNQIVIGYEAMGLGSNTAVLGNDSITLTGLKGNVAIGATTASAKLDVRAQGALSTDIAFRVRNSADTANILNAVGTGQVWSNGKGGITTNTAYGENVFEPITSGYLNGAFGRYALQNVTSGYENNAFGYMALNSLTSGYNNTSIGYQAGRFITSGTFNTAVGAFALQLNNSPAGFNTAIGHASFQDSTSERNTGLGYWAGKGITSGQYNTIIGFSPVSGITTGSGNTIVGSQIGAIGNVSNTAIFADGNGNIAIRKDASHFVGVGYSGTATLGAKLDVKAQGAAVTDLALRVRNSADTSNLFVVKGNGVLNAANLPTSPTGLVTGDIWNNLGILSIV